MVSEIAKRLQAQFTNVDRVGWHLKPAHQFVSIREASGSGSEAGHGDPLQALERPSLAFEGSHRYQQGLAYYPSLLIRRLLTECRRAIPKTRLAKPNIEFRKSRDNVR